MALKKDSQLFTVDLLLALVPLTIVLGLSANIMSGIVSSQLEYATSYEKSRIALDMGSVLSRNSELGLAADITASGDVAGSPAIRQRWTPPPLYTPPPIGPRPMIFTQINVTEWWVPFKRESLLRISTVDGRNILDIATMVRNRNTSTTLIGGSEVNLLNASLLAILSGGYPFRVAVLPLPRKSSDLTLASVAGIMFYNYSLVDLDGDGYIEEDEVVTLVPYAEYGTLVDLFTLELPVLFMFDERVDLSRYSNFTEDVYEVPVLTDSGGRGAVFLIFSHPELINKSWIKGNEFALRKTGIPMPVPEVTISRRHPYSTSADDALNGTITISVNSVEVFSGTLGNTENRSITETFVAELRPGANVVKVEVSNCAPNSTGRLFVRIKGTDMWVSQRILMMPAHLVVAVSGGRVG